MDMVSRSRLLGMEVLRDDASVAGFITQIWLSPTTRSVIALGVRDRHTLTYWPVSNLIRVEHVVIMPRSLQPLTLDPSACVSLYGARLSNPPRALAGSAYVSDFQFDLATGAVSSLTVATLRLNLPLNPLLGLPGLTKLTELANISLSSLNAITVTTGAATLPLPETNLIESKPDDGVAIPESPEPVEPAAVAAEIASALAAEPAPLVEFCVEEDILPTQPAPVTFVPMAPRFNIKAGQPLRPTFVVKPHGQVPKPLRPTLRAGGFAQPRVH